MYETDLTDFQWQVIQEILPDTRRRKHSLRLIINALLYPTKSAYQWRRLPHEFPPFPLVYYYFRRWQVDGRWTALNQALVRRHRQRAAPSRQPSPSVANLDAQSIKCSERGVADKGFDGHEKSRAASATSSSIPAAGCWPLTSGRPTKTTGSAARKR
jgi:putative transposase